ncbi:MAG: hypothetical protein Q9165_007849 [Trypethelium subeluteriae]
MTENATARDALVNRKLPEMVLSDGSPASLTSPPPPLPQHLDAEGRATRRFAVKGNAIITGGAGTLAIQGARALLEHGLSALALLDISTANASQDFRSLRDDFPSANIFDIECDIRDAERVNAAVEEAAGKLGGIDILCCFAGVVGCTHAAEMSPEEQMMKKGTGGSIVFIASISAHRVNFPQPQVAYNVSKAAIVSMKSSLAAEWARCGIRVNSISPGYMDTVLNEGPGLEGARRSWASRNPMGRMGVPAELQGPLVLLCSGAGSYINGSDLIVDGGGHVF